MWCFIACGFCANTLKICKKCESEHNIKEISLLVPQIPKRSSVESEYNEDVNFIQPGPLRKKKKQKIKYSYLNNRKCLALSYQLNFFFMKVHLKGVRNL